MDNSAEMISAVDEIVLFNAERKRSLVAVKYARMAESAFAFFRGTDHLFARRWSQFRPSEACPSVLACGDLHLENFGAYETDDGDFRFDINDFDEALVAPANFDLVRCAASILLAGEVWKIPAAHASALVLDYLNAYRAAVATAADSGQIGQVTSGKGTGPIWELLGDTASGEQTTLLDRHTEQHHHGDRTIRRSADRHPEASDRAVKLVREAVQEYGKSQPKPAAYRVLDVTGRIMGIGSLGVRRYTVLVAGGGTDDTNRLLDVKEAAPCSVLAASNCPQPEFGGNDAERVVRAQRQLQSKPPRGLATLDIDGRHFRVRETVPDENRSKLDRLQSSPDKLRGAAAVAGQLTAWSQLRGCESLPTNLPTSSTAECRGELAMWAASSAIDGVATAAMRCADLTCGDFDAFSAAYAKGKLAT